MASGVLCTYTNIAIKDVIGRQISHDFPITELSCDNVSLMEESYNLLSKISSRLTPWHEKKGSGVSIDQKSGYECLFIRSINAGLATRFARERSMYREQVIGSLPKPKKIIDADNDLLARVEILEKKVAALEANKK